MKPLTFRFFLISRLPLAYLAGLHLKEMSDVKSVLSMKHRWINQNPFTSMYFAAQLMGLELSTGLLCFSKIKKLKKTISMLVTQQEANFTKKARGRITFICDEGLKLDTILQEVIQTKEEKSIKMNSIAIDEQADMVSKAQFLWSFKLKS